MRIIDFSKSAAEYKGSPNTVDTDIHLFTQFFIHRDSVRFQEIKECLRKNVENPNITSIYLLNERIYTSKELGVDSLKIIQVNIGNRLKYQHVFKYCQDNAIKGYFILANSDIFLDNSISNLLKSDIHLEKKMFALLRYEYNTQNINKSQLFGPRFDSQDTWIFHSNFPIIDASIKPFHFQFGKPGCDNKMLYLMKILGYQIYNDPLFIKTYHYHTATSRDYNNADAIKDPWAVSIPYGVKLNIVSSLYVDLKRDYEHSRGFQDLQFEDNNKIHDYIVRKLSSNQNFVIPRISGIENNIAVFARIGRNSLTIPPDIMNYFKNVVPAMKNNAGIKLSSLESIMKYSEMYLKAFDNAEMYCGWESQGNYIHHIAQSHAYMKNEYSSKQIVWSFALDIFHYIFEVPWTHSLRGKRILVISPFETSILEKIPVKSKIYQKDGQDVDLFPECEIVTIKPPQTQADEQSREFDKEFADFIVKLDAIRDTYDIALVSAGGYGNLICNHIYESGKSAIYVGGVLQMYFGILGNRWLQERPDIVRLFMNEYWSRPKTEEKPKNCEKVEKGCYW
jgi:hypothetical protein